MTFEEGLMTGLLLQKNKRGESTGSAKPLTVTQNGVYTLNSAEIAQGYIGFEPVTVNVNDSGANYEKYQIDENTCLMFRYFPDTSVRKSLCGYYDILMVGFPPTKNGRINVYQGGHFYTYIVDNKYYKAFSGHINLTVTSFGWSDNYLIATVQLNGVFDYVNVDDASDIIYGIERTESHTLYQKI